MTGGLMYEYSGIRAEQLPDGRLRHPLFAMRIGRSVIAGLPGEPFGALSAQLRRDTLRDDLIVAEKANGWTTYHPTAEEWATGGHEPNAALFEARTDQVLMDGARRMIAALMRKGT